MPDLDTGGPVPGARAVRPPPHACARAGRRPGDGRSLRSLAVAFAVGWVGCVDAASSPGPSGPRVTIDVAALSLVGVADVVWDIEVANGATTPATVWQRRITSSAYGDGAGSASYVAPCDASAGVASNTVKVWVVGVYDVPVGAAAAGSFNATHDGVAATSLVFQNPTVAGPLTQVVTCAQNADAHVRFDVALMRPAEQGFFDIAVAFADVFCSAKFDCAAGNLLHDATGDRAPTMVLGFACTAGVSNERETILYLDHLQLDCTDPTAELFAADVRLDPSGPAGNQCAAQGGAMSDCAAVDEVETFDADGILFQLAVYRGVEELKSGGLDAQKVYWNVALGVRAPIAGCWLRARATAADAAGSAALSNGAIAAGAVYPYVRWDVPLGACGAEGLTFGDESAKVRPAYTTTAGAGLAFAFGFGPSLPAGPVGTAGEPSCAAPNAPPVAGAPELASVFGEPVTFSVAEVLAGSTDPDGDLPTVVAVSGPVNGTVELGAGSIQFVPDYGQTSATFQFTIDDGCGGQGTGTATVAIDLESDPSTVAGWGRGNTSSLGHGATSDSAVPIFAIGGHDFVSLDGGPKNSCAIDAVGQAWCWGIGNFGQLGNGFNQRVDFPVPVAGGHDFVSVGMGQYHGCALDTAGQAWCWGVGGFLGAGATQPDSNVPVAVEQGALVFDFIDVGQSRTCALTPSDDAWCWGDNTAQTLGIGVAPDQYAPVHAQPGEKYVEIRCSRIATCGRTAGGAIRCWGYNNSGNLGDGSGSNSATPVDVQGGRSYVGMAGYHDTWCAVEAGTQRGYCWGSGTSGQIGDGGTAHAPVPTLVGGGHSFTAISAGNRHACGIDAAGAAWCWGYGRYGRLGNGDASDIYQLSPVLVLGGHTHSQIHAGDEFSASLVVVP